MGKRSRINQRIMLKLSFLSIFTKANRDRGMKKGIISRNIGLLMEHFSIPNETQLAKLVGLPQSTINKLISSVSSDPRISTLTPIIEHFNLSFDTLFNENPVFSTAKENEAPNLLIPLITYEEIGDIYDNLDALRLENWPHWYPIQNQKEVSKYYAIYLSYQELIAPFDQASILAVQNKPVIEHNTYCIVKHLDSNSISLKKTYTENGKQWLLPLMPDLPRSIFDKDQWAFLGTIRAITSNLTKRNFIYMEE